jgi:hypothetical protein
MLQCIPSTTIKKNSNSYKLKKKPYNSKKTFIKCKNLLMIDTCCVQRTLAGDVYLLLLLFLRFLHGL